MQQVYKPLRPLVFVRYRSPVVSNTELANVSSVCLAKPRILDGPGEQMNQELSSKQDALFLRIAIQQRIVLYVPCQVDSSNPLAQILACSGKDESQTAYREVHISFHPRICVCGRK